MNLKDLLSTDTRNNDGLMLVILFYWDNVLFTSKCSANKLLFIHLINEHKKTPQSDLNLLQI